MAWTYDQPGVTYDRPGLTYDGGNVSLGGGGSRQFHAPATRLPAGNEGKKRNASDIATRRQS